MTDNAQQRAIKDAEKRLKQKQALEDAERRLLEQQSLTYESSTPTRLAVLLNALGEGGSLGFMDEISSAVPAIGAFLSTPGDRTGAFSDVYNTKLAEEEARNEEFRRAYPLLDFSGQAAGGTLMGGATGYGASMSPMLRSVAPIPRLMGAGAIEGGLYGAGSAPPGQRMESAKLGAGVGAIGGPMIAAGGSLTMAALRPAVRRLGESLLGTPRDRAIKEVMKALDADQITRREAMAIIRSHPDMALVDLGDATQRLGRVATSRYGRAASQGKRFLDERQQRANQNLRQRARLAAAADDSFDGTIVSVINNAESQAAPIYDEVFSQVIDVTPTMLDLLSRPAMRTARAKAAKIIANEGFSTDIIDDVTDVRYMDAVKRALDDMEGAATGARRRNEARVLGELRRDFVSEIDAQVPRYAEARSIFAGEQRIREASDFGRSVLRGRQYNTPDAVQRISEMTDAERKAARLGFLDYLEDEISMTDVNRATIINKFERVPKYRDITRALFEDQQAVEAFLNEAATNAQFARTRNLATGGSPTARIQGDVSSLEDGLFSTALDAAISPTTALANILRRIKGNTQLSDDTINAIGDILFDPDILPRQLRRGPAAAFDIPRMQPLPAAGAAGGFSATTVNPYIEHTLRDLGVLGVIGQQ